MFTQFLPRKNRLAVLLLALAIGSHATESRATTFSFTEFENASWSTLLLRDTTPVLNIPVIFAGQSSGNGSLHREITHGYQGPGNVAFGHIVSSVSYTPSSQGAINSFDFSFDLIFKSQSGGSVPGAVGYGALLLQNGTYYVATGVPVLSTQTSFTAFSLPALTALDFNDILGPGPGNPDFTSTGSLIQLGFFSSNGSSFGGFNNTVSGIDNLIIATNNVSAIPVPATLAIFGLGLAGLGFARRKKQTA